MEFVAELGDPKNFPDGVDTSLWPKYEGWNAMQFYQEAYEVFLQAKSQAIPTAIEVYPALLKGKKRAAPLRLAGA